MNRRIYLALSKYASTNTSPPSTGTSNLSSWIENNPGLWSGLKWGAGSFGAAALLATLFGSKSPVGWGLLAALGGGAYGLHRGGYFTRKLPGGSDYIGDKPLTFYTAPRNMTYGDLAKQTGRTEEELLQINGRAGNPGDRSILKGEEVAVPDDHYNYEDTLKDLNALRTKVGIPTIDADKMDDTPQAIYVAPTDTTYAELAKKFGITEKQLRYINGGLDGKITRGEEVTVPEIPTMR